MQPISERKYTDEFECEFKLKSGEDVVMRLIGARDRDLLERGFNKLSEHTKYQRFFTAKPRITDAELDYLTQLGGDDHVAIGAAIRTPDGLEGIGVARFVRTKDDPEVAEPAVVVVDDYQGNGIGSLLLRHLSDAARERGVRCFVCDVLAGNDGMRHVLSELSDDVQFNQQGSGIVEVILPLFPVENVPDHEVRRERSMQRLLSHAAQQVVSFDFGRRVRAQLRPLSAGLDALAHRLYVGDDDELPETTPAETQPADAPDSQIAATAARTVSTEHVSAVQTGQLPSDAEELSDEG